MTLYPMFSDLRKKGVVVIGGGKVATRKLKGLVETGAVITVVSPTATEEMRRLLVDYSINWLDREYQKEDIKAAHLVVIATNDQEVNRKILSETSDWQWVNMADGAERGNFHIPAQVKRGKLQVAISTSGASPGLSKKIRKDLSAHFGETYEGYLEFLGQCRDLAKLLPLNDVEKRHVLEKLLDPCFQNPRLQETILTSFPAYVEKCLEETAQKALN